jgi:hypothetical protein
MEERREAMGRERLTAAAESNGLSSGITGETIPEEKRVRPNGRNPVSDKKLSPTIQ